VRLRAALALAALALAAVSAACGRGGETEEASGPRNLLRWTTSWEKESVGFDIYRAPAREGPFERITKAPIPGGGVSKEPQSYSYADTEIDPAREYFYYVEVVQANGDRKRITPVMRAAPKAKG
jgi:hypothetical protein